MPIYIDTNLLFYLATMIEVLTLFAALLLLIKYWSTFPAVRWFACGKVSIIAGLICLIMRDYMHIGFSIMLTTTFLALGHAFFWFFARQAQERRIYDKRKTFWLIMISYLLIITYYTFYEINIQMRIISSGFVYFLFSLYAICELLLPTTHYKKLKAPVIFLSLCFTSAILRWGYYVSSAPMLGSSKGTFFQIQEVNLDVTYILTSGSELLIIIGVFIFIAAKQKCLLKESTIQ
ncbi:hypothetical protein [Curvivirga sp.]|uniref:hypothetical protein n=1 Tax=Curvivirga sp. TaxID=2856848 RepID=UPI003B5B471C